MPVHFCLESQTEDNLKQCLVILVWNHQTEDDLKQCLVISVRNLLLRILQELQELDARHTATDSSIALALSEVDQQVSSRQVQISALQEESKHRCNALQAERQKVLKYFPCR